MKIKVSTFLLVNVFTTALALTSQAAIMTFDTGQANNADLSSTFGSNLTADIAGASVSN